MIGSSFFKYFKCIPERFDDALRGVWYTHIMYGNNANDSAVTCGRNKNTGGSHCLHGSSDSIVRVSVCRLVDCGGWGFIGEHQTALAYCIAGV